jgi:uncharacterized membrane protein
VSSDASRSLPAGRLLPAATWQSLERLAPVLVPTLLVALGTAGLTAASSFRHSRFGSNAYDLGIYDQILWGFSRFEVAMDNTISHAPNLIGGHLQPLLFLLTPLYWVWADPRALLAVQALALSLGSVPVFLWAREQLGLAAAALFQLSYLIFFGLLAGNLFDFHPIALGAPIVSLALYALVTRRTRLLVATTVLGLLVREDLPLTFAAIGLFAAVFQRRIRLGLVLAGASLAWFVVALKLLLPAISGRAYAHWFYPGLGSGPLAALQTLVTDPIESVKLFFTPRAKQTALFNLLAPWLALPLLSPLFLIALPVLAERFFSNRPEYWWQGFHYSLILTPILAFAAVDTTARARRVLAGRAPAWMPLGVAAAVLLAGAYFSFARLKPLDELRRYTSAAHVADLEACLRTIPPDASVAATSAVVPHLSRRRSVYLLDRRPIPATEYIAVDAYTWTFPLTATDLPALVRRSLDGGYGVRCTRPGTVVLQRGAESRRVDPSLTGAG